MRLNKENTVRDIEIEKEICTFLERKLDKFIEYQLVTGKIKRTVCGNDEKDELIELINRRKRCINAIEKMNLFIEKIMKSGSIKFSSISEKYKGLVESCLSSIKDIIMQVEFKDRELVTIESERSDSIKTELLKMRNMRQAAKEYHSNRRYPAKFLDTRR